MDILVGVFLPLSLAVIMLSLGVGLTPADFRRVTGRGRAFLVGAACQLVLVPLVAYAIVRAVGLPGELAAGVMLVAFCPGGVTTNILARLAGGDVALSVSLTAVISLLSIVTLPVLVGWAVVHFMGAAAPDVSVTSLGLAMFLITALPVALGMGLRHQAPDRAARVEPVLTKVATGLFVVVILGALASNWGLFLEHIGTLGPALAVLIAATMALGLGVATLAGLDWRERKTITVEVGIQNGSLGVTLAALIMAAGVGGGAQAAGIPAIGLPSAVYGILMYVVGLPVVWWLRGRTA